MENSNKGPLSTMRNMYNGKHYSLPPKSPFPSSAPFYAQNGNTIGSKGIGKHRGVHQRTSSESLVMEEQPCWLDELLDEPETPVNKRGHRRSSSDSFTCMEAANANIQQAARGTQDFDRYKVASFYTEQNPMVAGKNRVWAFPQNALLRSASLGASTVETRPRDSEADANCSKQQVAQRSRVRKLQYIAELERNVQTLQAEGCKASSELKFLNQRSLILTMENKALKQRLENLAQEQLIKYLEQEVLEREIERLKALYKQQQQPPTEKPVFSHRRTNSIELQFADLSLKSKESGALCDAFLGSLRI